MADVTLIRTRMSKTKNMMMTIGVDEKQHIDTDHDMYFVRVYFDIRRALDSVTPGNPYIVKLARMANRYLVIFRNDNEEVIRQSVTDILEYCTKYNIPEIAFNEYELKGTRIVDIVRNYDINVYLTTIR